MSKFHDKVEGRTKQFVGQIIGDDQLVREGKTQERKAEDDRSGRGDQSAPHQEMAHSDQGYRQGSEGRRATEGQGTRATCP